MLLFKISHLTSCLVRVLFFGLFLVFGLWRDLFELQILKLKFWDQFKGWSLKIESINSWRNRPFDQTLITTKTTHAPNLPANPLSSITNWESSSTDGKTVLVVFCLRFRFRVFVIYSPWSPVGCTKEAVYQLGYEVLVLYSDRFLRGFLQIFSRFYFQLSL